MTGTVAKAEVLFLVGDETGTSPGTFSALASADLGSFLPAPGNPLQDSTKGLTPNKGALVFFFFESGVG